MEINKWRNQEDLIAFLGAPFRYINLEVDIKWYEAYMLSRNNVVRCAITRKDEDEILGLVSLVNINYINQTAEFHIMIGNGANCAKGIGTFATNSILMHAFYNMNLRRIELGVLANNTRAINLYEKVGFKREGLKKQAVFKNGQYIDMVQYAILKDEYTLPVEIARS